MTLTHSRQSAGVLFFPYDFAFWLHHMTLIWQINVSNIYISTAAAMLIKLNKLNYLRFSFQEFCSFNETFCLYDDLRTVEHFFSFSFFFYSLFGYSNMHDHMIRCTLQFFPILYTKEQTNQNKTTDRRILCI